MPPRKAIASEEEGSQGSDAPPLKKHKTSAAVSEVLAPRKRMASNKQSVLDENAVNANEKKVQDLEKKLAKAKQDAKKAKQLSLQPSDDEEYESEEKDPRDFPADNFCGQITQLPSVDIASKSTTKLRRSNITQERSALLVPISQLLSNRTFLKVPHMPMSTSPEPVDHETPAQSPPSRHTSPSSIGYAGDAVVSSPYFDNRSQDSLLPPPSTQRSLPPPSTQVRRKESFPTAELLHGVMSSSRAKACDYIDVVNAILVRTMFEFEGLVSTHDAFPSPALRREWALHCWKMASRDADEFYNLSDRMCGLIKKRGSRIRGHVLVVVRPQLIAIYGFKRKVTPQTITRNRKLSERLLENGAFHYKDTDTLTGFSQNKIISEILYLAWFENKTAQGPLLPHYFNPIPLETLAFIFTMIDFCLHEWSTTFIQSKFYEKDILDTHKAYRLELEVWSAINPSVIENIRKKLFNHALRSAGVVNPTTKVPTCLQDAVKGHVQTELDGRTGETDSEASDV